MESPPPSPMMTLDKYGNPPHIDVPVINDFRVADLTSIYDMKEELSKENKHEKTLINQYLTTDAAKKKQLLIQPTFDADSHLNHFSSEEKLYMLVDEDKTDNPCFFSKISNKPMVVLNLTLKGNKHDIKFSTKMKERRIVDDFYNIAEDETYDSNSEDHDIRIFNNYYADPELDCTCYYDIENNDDDGNDESKKSVCQYCERNTRFRRNRQKIINYRRKCRPAARHISSPTKCMESKIFQTFEQFSYTGTVANDVSDKETIEKINIEKNAFDNVVYPFCNVSYNISNLSNQKIVEICNYIYTVTTKDPNTRLFCVFDSFPYRIQEICEEKIYRMEREFESDDRNHTISQLTLNDLFAYILYKFKKHDMFISCVSKKLSTLDHLNKTVSMKNKPELPIEIVIPDSRNYCKFYKYKPPLNTDFIVKNCTDSSKSKKVMKILEYNVHKWGKDPVCIRKYAPAQNENHDVLKSYPTYKEFIRRAIDTKKTTSNIAQVYSGGNFNGDFDYIVIPLRLHSKFDYLIENPQKYKEFMNTIPLSKNIKLWCCESLYVKLIKTMLEQTNKIIPKKTTINRRRSREATTEQQEKQQEEPTVIPSLYDDDNNDNIVEEEPKSKPNKTRRNTNKEMKRLIFYQLRQYSDYQTRCFTYQEIFNIVGMAGYKQASTVIKKYCNPDIQKTFFLTKISTTTETKKHLKHYNFKLNAKGIEEVDKIELEE